MSAKLPLKPICNDLTSQCDLHQEICRGNYPKMMFFRLVSCYNLAALLSYIHISPLLSYTIIIYSHDTRFPLSKLPVVTAQGGGGSFKDRKAVGEVSCSDAWMAERTR